MNAQRPVASTRSGIAALASSVLVCGAILGAPLAAQPAALAQGATAQISEGGASVTITITNLRSVKGVVRACMTTKKKIFPKCRKDETSHRTVVKAKEQLTIQFNNVKPGDYAIALLHDENDDGKANRALGMMPKEGFGFSRDAKVRMGPPKFEDAVFTQGTADQALTIKMRYFL